MFLAVFASVFTRAPRVPFCVAFGLGLALLRLTTHRHTPQERKKKRQAQLHTHEQRERVCVSALPVCACCCHHTQNEATRLPSSFSFRSISSRGLLSIMKSKQPWKRGTGTHATLGVVLCVPFCYSHLGFSPSHHVITTRTRQTAALAWTCPTPSTPLSSSSVAPPATRLAADPILIPPVLSFLLLLISSLPSSLPPLSLQASGPMRAAAATAAALLCVVATSTAR